MKNAYYVPSRQVLDPTQPQGRNNSRPVIAEQLKLLKQKKSINISLHSKNDINVSKQKHHSQQQIIISKFCAQRRQRSEEDNQFSQINASRQQQQTQHKGRELARQQISVNCYQSPQTNKTGDYVNKDKTVFKTEPDARVCSERLIGYCTPHNPNKQIKQKNQIRQICNTIYHDKKVLDEQTINLQSRIEKKQDYNISNAKEVVQEKILDLLLLSTRELKIKLSDQRHKQSSVPKTTRSGLPADFFNFKK